MKHFIHIFLALFSFSEVSLASEVRLGWTLSTAPYYVEGRNSGIELEIVREAFKASGQKTYNFLNLHYQRAISQLKHGGIDAIVGNRSNSEYHKEGFYLSDKTLDYVDCVICLKSKKLKINSGKDLQGKSVWAFKSARNVLGPEFKNMADKNPLYSEEMDQSTFHKVILKGRVDAVISDRNIFMAQFKQNKLFQKVKDKFSFFKISPPTARAVIFTRKSLRDRFNRGLKLIKKSGIYKKILQRYKNSYQASCH